MRQCNPDPLPVCTHKHTEISGPEELKLNPNVADQSLGSTCRLTVEPYAENEFIKRRSDSLQNG